jgi:hypothetical protein
MILSAVWTPQNWTSGTTFLLFIVWFGAVGFADTHLQEGKKLIVLTVANQIWTLLEVARLGVIVVGIFMDTTPSTFICPFVAHNTKMGSKVIVHINCGNVFGS